MSEFHFVSFVTSYMDKIVQGDVGTYWDIFKPNCIRYNPALVYPYYDSVVDGYHNLFVVMKAGTRRPLYLPDELAEGMQVVASLFDYQIDRLTMRYIHESVFDLLRLLMRLIDIRSTLMWFLMFNQYQQPFDTLRIMTDWWFSYFGGSLPIIFGLDLGPTLASLFLGWLTDNMSRIVFTMPYLASEGIVYEPGSFENIEDCNPELIKMFNQYGQTVRLFRGLPKLWEKYPIPNNIREEWFTSKPYITEFMLNKYLELGIDSLPDRIIQKLYNEQGYKVSEVFLPTDFNNLKNISTSLACFIDTNVLQNLNHIHF